MNESVSFIMIFYENTEYQGYQKQKTPVLPGLFEWTITAYLSANRNKTLSTICE